MSESDIESKTRTIDLTDINVLNIEIDTDTFSYELKTDKDNIIIKFPENAFFALMNAFKE